MKQHWINALITALLLSAVLSACGQSTATPQATAAVASPTLETIAAASATPTRRDTSSATSEPDTPATATAPRATTAAPTATATAVGEGGWLELEPMAVARSEMPAALLHGRIYVPGGYGNSTGIFVTHDAFEAYDIAAGTWLQLAPLPEPRHHLMAAGHVDAVYVFGGGGPDGAGQNTWRYDPAADAWQALSPMPEARVAGVALALGDYLYVVGGQGATQDLLRYDPAANAWNRLAPMREPREHTAAVAFDGQIWAIGGRWTGATSSVESYDPQTDAWTTRTRLRQQRAGFGAAVLEGKIYVAGGELLEGAPTTLDSIEVYDPDERTWQVLPLALPLPLHGLPIVAADGRLYIVGGSGIAGSVSNLGRLFVLDP